MQEMTWLDTHLGSLDDAIKVINDFKWYISVVESNGIWYVTTGDREKHVIFRADNREAADAFLYGMGLAYSGIPGEFYDQLVKDVNEWFEDL